MDTTQMTVLYFKYLRKNLQRSGMSKSSVKSAKKAFKNQLKLEKNRNNLSLFCEYAMLEKQSGNEEEACKILQTALALHSNDNSLELWKAYVTLLQILINRDREKDVIWLLSNVVIGEKYSHGGGRETPNSLILQAGRKYTEKLKHEALYSAPWLDNPHSELMDQVVVCAAWFYYLTKGAASGCEVFKQAETRHQSHDLHQAYLEMLTYSVTRAETPLVDLRAALTDALHLHPHSPVFLTLFINTELRFMISGRLRSFFHKTSDDITSTLYAVASEVQYEARKSEANKVLTAGGYPVAAERRGMNPRLRHYLESAVSSVRFQHCPLLWRLYLRFVYVSGGDVGVVLTRAVQQCPYSKVLYMDGIQYAPEELRRMVDLMTEKGLRIRLLLEELEILREK